VTQKFLIWAVCFLAVGNIAGVSGALAEQDVGDAAVEVEPFHHHSLQRVKYSRVSFATNRKLDTATLSRLSAERNNVYVPRNFDIDRLFSSDLNIHVTIGELEVEYPPDREVGEQTGSFGVVDDNPLRNFVITKCEFDDSVDVWLNEAIANYSQLQLTSTLMYVPGFNVSFSAAVTETAQLKEDLDFSGPIIIFSWPSNLGASLSNYLEAGRREAITIAQFSQIIRAIDSFRFDNGSTTGGKLNEQIIAHSMGAQLILDSLHSIRDKADEKMVRLKTLILTAPDISKELFWRRDLPVIHQYSERTFIFCSAIWDVALATSDAIHMLIPGGTDTERSEADSERLGECEEKDRTIDEHINLDDPKWIKFHGPRRDLWAHSYFLSDPGVLYEIKNQINAATQ
jgi:esterase/lipase superfamily enzyme